MLGRGTSRDEADLLEAALMPNAGGATRRTPSQDRTSFVGGNGMPKSPRNKRATILPPGHARRSSEDGAPRDRSQARSDSIARRLSMSSASSGEWATQRWRGNLGLVPMDTTHLPLSGSVFSEGGATGGLGRPGGSEDHAGDLRLNLADVTGAQVAYIWTANTDYGKVLRIGFKKRIAVLWLEAHSLRQYVELNMTAFEKILKKYDKNTNSKLKKRYINESVLTDRPWKEENKVQLDAFIDAIHFLYARIAAGGDIELAKQQLRAQLREKVSWRAGCHLLATGLF